MHDYNELLNPKKRRRRVKLVFNPGSGSAGESPVQLMDIINRLQVWNFMPEVYLIEPGGDLVAMVQDTLRQGISMFVVCGGDGTVASVAKTLVGLPVTLGIIPTGTRNNIAHSLNIPQDIATAIAILRTGRRIKTDVGIINRSGIEMPFLEICSVGLMSSLFPSADGIQHGHVDQIGDFLATLANSGPSDIRLMLENRHEVKTKGHVVLVTNMPYVGNSYQVGRISAYRDGLLDVLVFANLNKRDLLGCSFPGTNMCDSKDKRILHFLASELEVDASPAMTVMADGIILGDGPIQIRAVHNALAVMTAAPDKLKKFLRSEKSEKPKKQTSHKKKAESKSNEDQ